MMGKRHPGRLWWERTRANAALKLLVSSLALAAWPLLAGAEPVKVLVSESSATARQRAADLGGKLLADQPNQFVIEIDEAQVSLLGPDAAVRSDFDTIFLRAGAVDTTQPAMRDAKDFQELRLVQFVAPPVAADLEALESAGAQIVHYLPQNAYLVWCADAKTSKGIDALSFRATNPVQYHGDYSPAYRVTPNLAHRFGKAPKADHAVMIQLYGKGKKGNALRTGEDLDFIRSNAAILKDAEWVLNDQYVNIRVSADEPTLRQIAELSTVVMIEAYVPREKHGERQGQSMAGNVTAGGGGPNGPGYLQWLLDLGFSQDPEDYPVLVVVDDGVDNGTVNPANPEFRFENNQAGASRIMFSVLPPGSGVSSPDGRAGHGNINASIAGGYNTESGTGVEDTDLYNYGLGISPYTRLGNTKVFSDDGFFDGGLGDATMVRDYYNRGARISTNSWGASVNGEYTTDAQLYDSLTRDADNSASGDQELLFIFSAGNSGPGSDTIGSPGTAKNVVTVGASETNNPASSVGDGCGLGAGDGDSLNDMVFFSSRGPVDDGRIKPELVAPGSFIHGARPLANFTGEGVCGGPNDATFPSGTNYTWSSGTSHSCPGVAGMTTLIAEYLHREFGFGVLGSGTNEPAPALIKALTVLCTRYMTGSDANDNLPSNDQGYGTADLGVLFESGVGLELINQEVVFSASGEEQYILGVIDDQEQPFRVVLSWTDPPGSTAGDAYINDLDLIVTYGGQTYYGNNMSGQYSVAGGSADTRNNTEAVFLPPMTGAPDVEIRVLATTIAGDGVPSNPAALDQDFALAIQNFSFVTSQGRLSFTRPDFNCNDTVELRLADLDLLGQGSYTLTITTDRGDSETISMTENPSGSGIFEGSLPTNTNAVTADGALNVQEGDTLSSTYIDADDGKEGTDVPVTASAIIDCTAPVISNVRITDVQPRSFIVRLDTNEDARPEVDLGSECGNYTITRNGPTGLEHAITVTGLEPESQYKLIVRAEDIAQNETIEDNNGNCFTVTTPKIPDYFTESFGGGLVDEGDSFDLAGKILVFEPGSEDGYRLCVEDGNGSFAVDPTGHTELNLSDDDFAAITLNNPFPFYGEDVTSIYIESNGGIAFETGSGSIGGLTNHFAQRRLSMLFTDLFPTGRYSYAQLSDKVVVTFEDIGEYSSNDTQNTFQAILFNDGRITITYLECESTAGIVGLSNGGGIPEYYEETDISAAGPCVGSAGRIILDRSVYNCEVGLVDVEVRDLDLTGTGSISVEVTNETGGDVETITLNELMPPSGIFQADVPLATGAGASQDGSLQIADGDTVAVEYVDADDGSDGTDVSVVETFMIDCSTPVISNVRIQEVTDRRATVLFDTNEPVTAEVEAGLSCGSALYTAAGALTTAHAIVLDGLAPDTAYYLSINVSDPAGNIATDDAGGNCYTFRTLEGSRHFTSYFSNGFGLDGVSVTFEPTGGPNGYTLCKVEGITSFPGPTGGTALSLSDDDFEYVGFGGESFSFYGVSYDGIYAGSNGYITFGAGDTDFAPEIDTHFEMPRISGLFTDLLPGSGSSITSNLTSTELTITYQNVSEYGTSNSNSFQYQLHFDGRITMTFIGIDALEAITGLSAGIGTPTDFVSENLLLSPVCGEEPTPTLTPSPSPSPSPMAIPTDTPTPTPTPTSIPPTATATVSPTATASPTASPTPSPSPTQSPSPTPSATPGPPTPTPVVNPAGSIVEHLLDMRRVEDPYLIDYNGDGKIDISDRIAL